MVLGGIEAELTLLKRHIAILKKLVKEEPIGIVKISKITGIPAHQVRYSLRVLQQSGFLQPTTKGAMTNAKAKNFLKNFGMKKNVLSREIESL